MEIKSLRYFLAIAHAENVTHATVQLHVIQPTLPKTLKGLKAELGKKLFTRKSFSIKLAEGEKLLCDRVEALVLMADKIESEFSASNDITRGTFYSGLTESYQIRIFAREINKFKQRYPDIAYHITSGDTGQVAEKIDRRLLDFGVTCEQPDSSKFAFPPFPDTDIWGAVIRKNHPLAEKKFATAEDLIGCPLFCPEQSWKNEVPSRAKEHFSALRLEGSFQLAYDGSMFTAEGLGILLTFENLINCSVESDLTFVPLSPECNTKFYLIWDKHQTFTPIARKFMEQMSASFRWCFEFA